MKLSTHIIFMACFIVFGTPLGFLVMERSFVDSADLKFQAEEVVTLKTGGKGQITYCQTSYIEKIFGDTPTPVYYVRMNTARGLTTRQFQEWELGKL